MGQAGNDNIGGRRFAYLTTLKTDASGYTWGTTGQKNYDKGITEGEIGVTNLTWETATKSNLGLEVGLWNALDITVDVFRENVRISLCNVVLFLHKQVLSQILGLTMEK